MKATDYLAAFLKSKGITHVFELSGGMITHILDSLYSLKTISIVSMHHEQGAAFAADGYSRVKNIPGIALATSGPGATNLLTGIGSCYFDSVPAIFITGQVNQHELKGDRKIRQLGFQETDIIAMASPITKKCFPITDVCQLPEILEEAFNLAIEGRPGPVLIDIPMNIQRADIKFVPIKNEFKIKESCINNQLLNQIFDLICLAQKPLILAGRGVLSSNSKKLFDKFIALCNIPVVTSLLAIDALAYNNPLRVGFIGSYGNRWANLSLGACDCLIVLGSRLDIRQTGADIQGFSMNKTIIHVDIEESEINNRIKNCIGIHSDIFTFLERAIHYLSQRKMDENITWLSQINALRQRWSDTNEIVNVKGINPNVFIHQLSILSPLTQGFIVDVGSHQMWAAQSIELNKDQFFITSGGMGAMGFALPAAIGACLAGDKKPVVVISGDGGIQLNLQELQTIIRNNLPIKIIILNNQSLGMIRQFQDSYFDSRHQSTVWGYSAPDFEKIANAYGINSSTISEVTSIKEAIKSLWIDPHTPYLLQVMIDPAANAYPKIAFGKPLTEMEPFSKPLDMEGT